MHYPELIPLEDYRRPAGPAVNQLDDWYQSLRRKFLDRDSEVSVTEDQLSKASIENIRSFTDEPDCAYVFHALDKAYLEWMSRAAVDGHLRLLVFPPCDQTRRVASWARHNNIDVLEAPDRTGLLYAEWAEVVIPDGDGPLVIPNLENWFIRHRHGLGQIRSLLAALQNTSRRCLISCSSWSWLYLRKSVNADLVLPAPDSLAPFDAENLGNWLLTLFSEESGQALTFRDYKDGKEVLNRDENGKISDKFMQQLADDSGGIPWIAWQLWRRSLRTEAESEDDGQADNKESHTVEEDEQQDTNDKGTVFWVVKSQPQTLPRGHEHAASLLLQALLIHGSLTEPVLSAVLPSISESNLVIALIRSGFVERHDDEIRCLASAYPVIWTSLSNSGMTMPAF